MPKHSQHDFVTILKSDRLSAKRVEIGQDGLPSIRRIEPSLLFNVEEYEVSGLDDLHALLLKLQHDPHKMVIRGRLIDGKPTEGIRRLSRDQVGYAKTFDPSPRRWVVIDIDNLPLPSDWSDIDQSADQILQSTLAALPTEFHNAACVYQWSNSMGFKQNQIRVHLWFWLGRAINDQEAKSWLSDYPVDLSLYRTVQPHYTANPVLGPGIIDPIAKRVGLYVPDGAAKVVEVPENLSQKASLVQTNRRFRNSSSVIDSQNIARDRETGLVVDGRERFLLLKSNDAVKELLKERNDPRGYPSEQAIAERTWQLFSAEADLEDGKWSYENARAEARRRRAELESGAYTFVSRTDVTTLEPAYAPYLDLDLVTADEAARRLDAALERFFESIDDAPRMALRITMGAGKTRNTLKHLQKWLAGQFGQKVEVYVSRHDLADQYIRDLKALEGGIKAEVIRHYPRTGGAKGDLPVLCLRPDYVRSLEAAKIGVFQAACRSNDGERCEHYEACPYITQYNSPDWSSDNNGNVVRVFVHSHLGLPRNPLQSDADLVIIDEAFLDQVISTDMRLAPAQIKPHIVTDRHPKLGRRIVEALEDGDPLLQFLREEGVTVEDLDEIDLDGLRPSVSFSSTGNWPLSITGNAGLHRSLSQFVTILREELSLSPPRDHIERLVYDPKADDIRMAVLREIDIPDTTAVLLLDATADQTLLEQVIGPVSIERIDVKQKAVVTQVYDRTGRKASWSGTNAPLDELIEVANAWAEFGEKPLIVANKAAADKLRDNPKRHEDVVVMHFQALRGSNAAEDCSVIFIAGRNMPPTPEVDLKARALFWDAAEPLQHDEAAQFRPKGAEAPKQATQFRGYIQSSRNPQPQSGIHVLAFSDARIDALLAQSRDAETMQALGRLRLVHAPYQKRVFLLSNLPVELPIDQLVTFSELMPARLELELIRRGNIPITALGLLKMRPDLCSTRDDANHLIQASNLADPKQSLHLMPGLWRSSIFVARFRAGNQRNTNQQHLFLGEQMESDGLAMAGKPPRLEDVRTILERGYPDLEGSGWGKVQDLTVDFLYEGIIADASADDGDDLA